MILDFLKEIREEGKKEQSAVDDPFTEEDPIMVQPPPVSACVVSEQDCQVYFILILLFPDVDAIRKSRASTSVLDAQSFTAV